MRETGAYSKENPGGRGSKQGKRMVREGETA